MFSEIGKETKVFLRFSTVGGEKDLETERARGFAIKFIRKTGIGILWVTIRRFSSLKAAKIRRFYSYLKVFTPT
jgi:hypothetical protein